MPIYLVKIGYFDWALAARTMLSLCWLVTIISAFWIALDVLILNRRIWAQIFQENRNQLIGWLGILFLSGPIYFVLFFGTLPIRIWALGGAVGLLFLSFLFVLSFPIFCGLIVCCNALLFCKPNRIGDDRNDRVARDKIAKLLRDSLFGGRSK